VEFNVDDFVTKDGYVTTKCLPDLLRVWMYNERNMLEEGRKERSREVHGMLSEVSSLTMDIILEHQHKKPGKEDFFTPFSTNDVKTAEVVLLSITVLGGALMDAKETMLTEDPSHRLLWPTVEILGERSNECRGGIQLVCYTSVTWVGRSSCQSIINVLFRGVRRVTPTRRAIW
jgi:hypothetical protein